MLNEQSHRVWQARADALLDGMGRVLRWARVTRSYAPTEACMAELLSLRGVASIVQDRRLPMPFAGKGRSLSLSGIPDSVLAPLRRYLGETGGYDMALPCNRQRSDEPCKQHSYVLRTLGQPTPRRPGRPG